MQLRYATQHVLRVVLATGARAGAVRNVVPVALIEGERGKALFVYECEASHPWGTYYTDNILQMTAIPDPSMAAVGHAAWDAVGRRPPKSFAVIASWDEFVNCRDRFLSTEV